MKSLAFSAVRRQAIRRMWLDKSRLFETRRALSQLAIPANQMQQADKESKNDYAQPLSSDYETHAPIDYPHFSFSVSQRDTSSNARLGRIVTPHGELETPNFIFCATKGAMKSLTMQQMRDADTQVVLSNTYHLMLTPGAEAVHRMGGLHKMTNWHGPMLTDSGGYQIFSMGHGSVSNEIKGRRGAQRVDERETTAAAVTPSLLRIDEEGALFRSFVDGMQYYLSPERSIQIQRQLGADLIVVFDECTPFNVEKEYTAQSMRRSHRWALRCLQEFVRTTRPPSEKILPQALYGIVQGGVYEDLRRESVEFVNRQPFFGVAIGGSLGATKRDMHEIVAFTRGLLEVEKRPVHLLGIGGIRDVFHGVRQGIDTFDCVHPTRLGRHGGALVKAKFWDEESGSRASREGERENETSAATALRHMPESVRLAFQHKAEKVMNNERNRTVSLSRRRSQLQLEVQRVRENHDKDDQATLDAKLAVLAQKIDDITLTITASEQRLKEIESGNYQSIFIKGYSTHFRPANGTKESENDDQKSRKKKLKVREHVSLSQSSMRDDHRPIDEACQCYTCRHHTRAYIHHLYKAKESLGGILVTIHNVHFMNTLMRDIRQGIKTGTLDAVEREYVHPNLKESLARTDGLSLGE